MSHKKKNKKSKNRPKTYEGRKRRFAYKPLKEIDRPKTYDGDYDRDAYEFFKSVKWDAAYQEFLTIDKDGRYEYPTVWALCKELAGSDKDQAKILYEAIGPADKKNKKRRVPYLGDWGLTRASFLIGEVNKESLLYSNPKIQTLREIVRKHMDVMEISQGLGELLMGWVGRYDAWATQIDEFFGYKLFDPKLSDEKNEKRFSKYTKMQEYIFSRTIDSTRQVLKCFGVGENDVALLTQMMIASMRERLGESTARIMMATAGGLNLESGGGFLPQGAVGDQAAIDGSANMIENNPMLKLMHSTFVTKSKLFAIEHPDLVIDGVPPADDRTDPKLDPPKLKTNGKHSNGKAAMKQ
jgi:hypothetical protein